MTQAQLAQASRMSQSAIANYESGTRLFPRSIFQLASALKVSASWLAEGTGRIEHDEATELTGTRLNLADGYPENSVSNWPFKDISPEIFWALSEADRNLVESTMAGLITSLFKNSQESQT